MPAETESGGSTCPANWTRSWPVTVSQSRASARPPVRNDRPSGANATDTARCLPKSNLRTGTPVATSQSVPLPAVSTVLPSGENAAESIGAVLSSGEIGREFIDHELDAGSVSSSRCVSISQRRTLLF